VNIQKYLVEDSNGKYFVYMRYRDGVYKPVFTTIIEQASVFLNISDALDICKLFPELKVKPHD
jgi:hypothetical protein